MKARGKTGSFCEGYRLYSADAHVVFVRWSAHMPDSKRCRAVLQHHTCCRALILEESGLVSQICHYVTVHYCDCHALGLTSCSHPEGLETFVTQGSGALQIWRWQSNELARLLNERRPDATARRISRSRKQANCISALVHRCRQSRKMRRISGTVRTSAHHTQKLFANISPFSRSRLSYALLRSTPQQPRKI